jgi:putative slyX protein
MIKWGNYSKFYMLRGNKMTDIHDQITDLQIKIAHLDNTTDTLNHVITQQDRALKDMQDQLKLLYKLLKSRDDDAIASFDVLADRPPHY